MAKVRTLNPDMYADFEAKENYPEWLRTISLVDGDIRDLSVVGNIFDNPELEERKDTEEKNTNADIIRAMTNGELATFLCKVKEDYQWSNQEFPAEDACGDWEEWLESEGELDEMQRL